MSLRSGSPEPSSKRPALVSHGSRSYEAKGRDKARILVIEETIARGLDASKESRRLIEHKIGSSEHSDPSDVASKAAATIALTRSKSNRSTRLALSGLRSTSQNQDPEQEKPSDSSANDSSIKSSRRSRPSWHRTRSDGVWYRTLKKTSSQDDRSAPSVSSIAAKSDNSEVSAIRIEPLKPPPRPDQPQATATDHIKVDTPFSQAEERRPSSLWTYPTAAVRQERRRSSIDTRSLFSAPLHILRKVVPSKSGKSLPSLSTPADPESQPSLEQAQGHKSLLKQDQTASTLLRAASLLEAHKKPKPAGRRRAHTLLKSVSTTSSSELVDSRQDMSKTVSPTFNISTKNSRWASTTSSILNIQMGSTPQNSPTEQATYKVKRSPSAETLEFLKIDISIRGGTSYLPSEARRIHTPPLPAENDTSMRRGFFFDYNPPKSNTKYQNSPLPEQPLQAVKVAISDAPSTVPSIGQELKKTLAMMQPQSRVMTREPMSHLSRMPSCRTTTTATSGRLTGFHDAKLAEIDATPVNMEPTPTESQDRHDQCKNKCLAEIHRRRYEAQLDYSIPEHYPTSPLCPRNPKYWRVVRNKGSQFRGCWMHGFGKYEVVPGLSMGI